MPTLHKKCDECGAILGPKAPEVPESILHERTCRFFMPVVGFEGYLEANERASILTAPPQAAQSLESPSALAAWQAHHEGYLEEARRRKAAPGSAQDGVLDDTWRSTSGASSSRKAPP